MTDRTAMNGIRGNRCWLAAGIAALLTVSALPGQSPADSGEPMSVEEIADDVRTLQRFFRDRFPGVPLQLYREGARALPQSTPPSQPREVRLSAPSGQNQLDLARDQWLEPLANGRSLDQCFLGAPAANEYPYARDGRVHTVEQDINECLAASGNPRLPFDSPRLIRLSAVFRQRSNGEPLEVDYSDIAMRTAYTRGRALYRTRRGQYDQSCADCHVRNAGNRFRTDLVSAPIGHPVRSPSLGGKWSGRSPWLSLHQRYSQCFLRSNATPLPLQSDDYVALEVFESIISAGIPLQVPGLRD